ncbi:hypothetical protein GG681_08255 [Epibacterium sp. SM1969]|uniref:Uncharacterized protein n=1 Tax=Tritonibacter aquimaris TaxID=2663379 RepID=A0A844AW75_9RHOB|nr:hypothetical protein [Tritonibacter aquimaris]MQY42634.1 hypothetical protein [Tritonibacter aquimaris]
MKLPVLVCALWTSVSPAAFGNEYAPAMKRFMQDELMSWAQSDVLIAAIKRQNARTNGYTQGDIEELDRQWSSEIGKANTPIITPVLGNAAAHFLRLKVAGSGGQISEAFIMDAQGLTVAASDITSDYWQGDEDKFTQSFGQGADAYHLGEVDLDHSTHMYQVQISLTLHDPDSGTPIGALTVGVVADTLK